MVYVNSDIDGIFVPAQSKMSTCNNGKIEFGKGSLNDITCSFFRPLIDDGVSILHKWYMGAVHGETEHAFRVVGFFKDSENKESYEILVSRVVTMTLEQFARGLSVPSSEIQGIEYLRVWNSYSCSLYKAKFDNLFCEAADLMVGVDHEPIIPFTFFEFTGNNKLNWFDGVEGVEGAYERAMYDMCRLYDKYNPYEIGVRQNPTMSALFYSREEEGSVFHFFRMQTIPVLYDIETFDAYIVKSVNDVQTYWKAKPNLAHQADYGTLIMTQRFASQKHWEDNVLSGQHGDEWRAELVLYNDKRGAGNNLPLSDRSVPTKDPLYGMYLLKNRRNCVMVFNVFARCCLSHGVQGKLLRTFSKFRLMKELDEIYPGALMRFYIEKIKTNNGLLKTRGY